MSSERRAPDTGPDTTIPDTTIPDTATPDTTPSARFDHELLRGIVDAAPDALVVIDATGEIVLVNHQAEALFGYEHHQLVGSTLESLVPEQVRARHVAHRDEYIRSPRTRAMGTGLPLVGRRKDGSECRVEISLSPLVATDDRDPPMTIAIVRDIGERLEFERQLRQAEEHLELLHDRERIARDLHDLVIQRLFAAGMALQGTVARVDDPGITSGIENVIDDLDATIRQLRSVIFGLQDRAPSERSVRRDALGVLADLRPALGFDPEITFDGPVDTLGRPLAEQVLPTLREALTNVARHAHATRARVTLLATATELVLEVVDNGVGIDRAAPGGNGLENARARARAVGGVFTLEPGATSGTVFCWRSPISA